MEVYRLALAKHANLNGVGGIYGAGRWHHRGQPIIYAGQSRSICVLERFVHEDPAHMPKLKLLTIHIPDNTSMQQVVEKQLPKHWDLIPESSVSRDFGSQWLKDAQSAILKLPSAIVPNEYNYLINPNHSDAQKIRILDATDFYYDPRLKAMIR